MKKVIYTSFLLMFLGLSLQAQSELIIEPGPPGVINDAIFGDTLATGERAAADRVYVLRRGFPYVLTGSVEFTDFHLRIKAEEGEGSRPFLFVDSGAGAVSQIFRMFGSASITLDGLHISGQDILGAYNNRIVRINSDNSQVFFNNCLIEEAGQSGIRVQGDNPRIYVTNSIFRNMGRPFNPANGRFIDNRGVPVDTLWVENSVIYNVTSRIYRNGSGSSIKWARFNQNTFWGSGQHGFSIGEIENLEFTNNIYFNGIFLGRDEEDTDTVETARHWIEIDSFIPETQNILFSNNNFYTDQEIIDAYPITDPGDGDVRVAIPDFVLDPEILQAIAASGTGDTNIEEDLDFKDAPIFPLQFIVASNTDTTSGGEVPDALPWDLSDLTLDVDLSAIGTGDVNRYRQVHDFTYPSSAVSATAGTEGQPIGANMELITSTPDIFVENRILYFPNPVANTLTIQNLENIDLERVAVFNLAGQQMLEFNNVENSILQINTDNLIGGTYILSIIDKAGNISSRKFLKQ